MEAGETSAQSAEEVIALIDEACGAAAPTQQQQPQQQPTSDVSLSASADLLLGVPDISDDVLDGGFADDVDVERILAESTKATEAEEEGAPLAGTKRASPEAPTSSPQEGAASAASAPPPAKKQKSPGEGEGEASAAAVATAAAERAEKDKEARKSAANSVAAITAASQLSGILSRIAAHAAAKKPAAAAAAAQRPSVPPADLSAQKTTAENIQKATGAATTNGAAAEETAARIQKADADFAAMQDETFKAKSERMEKIESSLDGIQAKLAELTGFLSTFASQNTARGLDATRPVAELEAAQAQDVADLKTVLPVKASELRATNANGASEALVDRLADISEGTKALRPNVAPADAHKERKQGDELIQAIRQAVHEGFVDFVRATKDVTQSAAISGSGGGA